jgi:hypothetical protein
LQQGNVDVLIELFPQVGEKFRQRDNVIMLEEFRKLQMRLETQQAPVTIPAPVPVASIPLQSTAPRSGIIPTYENWISSARLKGKIDTLPQAIKDYALKMDYVDFAQFKPQDTPAPKRKFGGFKVEQIGK